MTLHRLVLSTIFLLFATIFSLSAEAASSFADEFLAKAPEFRFGAQQTEDTSAGYCYSFGVAIFKPTNLNFGTVTIGEQKSLTFRIQNGGNGAAVRIDSIQSLNGRFTVTDAPKLPFCLPNNQSIDIEVTFSPNSENELVSQIRIRHTNNSNEVESSSVLVSGKGREGGGGGGITVNPGSLDFGLVAAGQNLTKSFTIKNNGSSPVTIQQVNSSNAVFSIVSPSFPRTLNGGQSVSVNVRFEPTKTGSASGKLSIVSNGQTVAQVGVSGAGGGNPDISVPNSLDFGQLDVGTFKEANLTISNSGNGTLEIQSFKFSDPGFEIIPSAPSDIPGGGQRGFKVKFKSTVKGAQTKSLTITSNDPDEKTVQVSMTANVIGGKLGFSDKSVSSRLRGNPIHTTALQWVDFNNDGKVDLYIVGTNGNVICNNAGQSKFTNGTGPAKLGNNNAVADGASWADIDNDGDLDVFIANRNGESVILKNNKGVFTRATTPLRADLTALADTSAQGGIWLDFNRDGRLDLYLIRDGAPNRLLKNTGIINLVDVASSAKVNLNSTGRSAVSADFNNDGLPDIFVVNFNRPNKLFINNGNETFRDVSTASGVGQAGPSLQATVSDYDQDGDIDIFVVRSGSASSLYRNQGNLKFQNATAAAGVAGPKNGKSASFADYDNDGDDDLLLLQTPGGNVFFRNNGAGKFVKILNVDLDESDDPSSVVNGDFNNDGLLDVVIGDGDNGRQNGDSIFVNTGGEGNNFLILTLQGTQSNRSGIGAKVLVRLGIIPQLKEVSAGNGKNQESLPLEFGLGTATQATSVQVFWPSGIVTNLSNVPAGRRTIIEGQ
jgi:hypothetical protein